MDYGNIDKSSTSLLTPLQNLKYPLQILSSNYIIIINYIYIYIIITTVIIVRTQSVKGVQILKGGIFYHVLSVLLSNILEFYNIKIDSTYIILHINTPLRYYKYHKGCLIKYP